MKLLPGVSTDGALSGYLPGVAGRDEYADAAVVYRHPTEHEPRDGYSVRTTRGQRIAGAHEAHQPQDDG